MPGETSSWTQARADQSLWGRLSEELRGLESKPLMTTESVSVDVPDRESVQLAMMDVLSTLKAVFGVERD